MAVPSDGLPNDLSPLTRQLLDEFRARTQLRLFPLRRRECRCTLASAYRVQSGDLLIGRRRAVVQQDAVQAQARRQIVPVALDEADGDFLVGEFSCKHGTAVTLPVESVRVAIAETLQGRRARDRDFLL